MRSFASVLVSVVTFTSAMYSASSEQGDSYLQERRRILKTEKALFIGGNIKLTAKENLANNIILPEKLSELTRGYENSSDFLPAQHFFQAKNKINQSDVFSIIKKIPKGASLHTHLLAGVSVDFIIKNITYRDNIYGCFLNDVFKLRFLKNSDQDTRCSWKSLVEYRENDINFDSWLRKQLSLEVDNPYDVYTNPVSVWQPFKKIFTTEYDMMCYRPVFKDYIVQLLKELYLDNVLYTELRGTFMPLYELDGTVYNNSDFFKIFIETVNEFKEQYPKFLGVRYIHSIYKGVTLEVLRTGIGELIELKKVYPDFIAGFDFVGYEEEGQPLVYFREVLQEASKHLKFFFHAGETNWYGHTDLNLVDAILLNTSRIGHGFGLGKHPVLINMAKERGIAIELCPISNQVLLLNNDPRNHPVVSLMANGFPVVIGNDDPSVWGATGLSYDWYVTFMAMTSENAGIEVLKQFAMDSIIYSAMKDDEKIDALEKWNQEWQLFLDELLGVSSRYINSNVNKS